VFAPARALGQIDTRRYEGERLGDVVQKTPTAGFQAHVVVAEARYGGLEGGQAQAQAAGALGDGQGGGGGERGGLRWIAHCGIFRVPSPRRSHHGWGRGRGGGGGGSHQGG